MKRGSQDVGPIICPGHSRPIPDLQYSRVTNDGYFIISSCLDSKAMLREGHSGDWIGTFIGHKGAVWCARLDNTATRAMTGSADFTAKLWNAVSGEVMHTFPHKHIVKSTVFSEDGNHAFTGGQEKKLRIFDLTKPDVPVSVLEGHTASIFNIACVPDRNLVVAAAAENEAKVWDQRVGEVVKTLNTDAPLSSLSITNDQSTICTTTGNTITMWDSTSFEEIKSFKLKQQVDCVAYHPQAQRFVAGSDSELWVRVYDYQTGAELACNKGHHGPVRCLAYSPVDLAYASGSVDGTIRIWDSAHAAEKLRTGQVLGEEEATLVDS